MFIYRKEVATRYSISRNGIALSKYNVKKKSSVVFEGPYVLFLKIVYALVCKKKDPSTFIQI